MCNIKKIRIHYYIILGLSLISFGLINPAFSMGSKLGNFTLDPGPKGRSTPRYHNLNNLDYLNHSRELFKYAQNKFFYGRSHSFQNNSRRLISGVFHAVKNDPVARFSAKNKYDPNRITGFCFGRALAAQLHARNAGISINDIKKVSVIGKLSASDSGKSRIWRYHITTVVRAADNVWYALDPIFNRPLSIHEWIRTTKNRWDKWNRATYYAHSAEVYSPKTLIQNRGIKIKSRLKYNLKQADEVLRVLNHSESQKIGPNLYGSSLPIKELTLKVYRNFFVDLFNNFRRNDSIEMAHFIDPSDEYPEIDWNSEIVVEEEVLLGSPVDSLQDL